MNFALVFPSEQQRLKEAVLKFSHTFENLIEATSLVCHINSKFFVFYGSYLVDFTFFMKLLADFMTIIARYDVSKAFSLPS